MATRVNGRSVPPSAVEYELQRLIKFFAGHMSAEQIRKQMDALRRKAKHQAIGAMHY